MYNYDFKNEIIKCELIDNLVEINNKELKVNVILTENSLLLFYNIANDFIKMKTQGVFVTPSYELLLKLKIKDFNYEVIDNNTYINNEEIIIYNFDINKVK